MKQSNLIKLYERSFQKYEISSNIIISVRIIHPAVLLGCLQNKTKVKFVFLKKSIQLVLSYKDSPDFVCENFFLEKNCFFGSVPEISAKRSKKSVIDLSDDR